MKTASLAFASAAMVFTCAAQAQLCTGQVGWWRFDGSSLDSSGLNNNGTFFGGTPNYVAGVNGLALELDGLDDFVRVANNASLNPPAALSLAAWARIRPFGGSGSDPIIDKAYFSHNPPYYQYQLGVTGSQYSVSQRSLSFVASTSTGNAGAGSNGPGYTTGIWAFIVGTFDGSVAKFYINGELVSANEKTGTPSDFGSPVQFGKFNNLPFYLPAAIDDIRIFDRAISPDEVAALFGNPAGGAVVLPAISGVCPGGSVTLRAAHLASPGATYSWKLNGSPLADGTLPDGTIVSGASSSSLTLTNLLGAGERSITCDVQSCLGTTQTPAANVRVCAADFNCDAQVDDLDFVAFAAAYNMLVCDDPAMPVGCPSDLNRDGGVDDLDFVFFAAAYNDLLCP